MNLTHHPSHSFMTSTTRYRYDSLGFITYERPGTDVIISFSYRYFFDPEKRILSSAYYRDNSQFPSGIATYSFDSSGYLISVLSQSMGYATTYTILYDQHKRVIKIKNRVFVSKELETEYYMAPFESVSRYYYHVSTLDSIIKFDYYKHFKPDCRKTYFDSSGLPIKTIRNATSEDKSRQKEIIYRYTKRS